MAHPQSYNVSFRFRSLPTHLLEGVMAFNADQAAKKARQDMIEKHGYSSEDLQICTVSTSRTRTEKTELEVAA
ncbi:MAG: hypothetical protein V7752_20695 [Halopseudomonas sp.]